MRVRTFHSANEKKQYGRRRRATSYDTFLSMQFVLHFSRDFANDTEKMHLEALDRF